MRLRVAIMTAALLIAPAGQAWAPIVTAPDYPGRDAFDRATDAMRECVEQWIDVFARKASGPEAQSFAAARTLAMCAPYDRAAIVALRRADITAADFAAMLEGYRGWISEHAYNAAGDALAGRRRPRE